MYTQLEKPKEKGNRGVTNSTVRTKSNGEQGFAFVNKRPEAIAQELNSDTYLNVL